MKKQSIYADLEQAIMLCNNVLSVLDSKQLEKLAIATRLLDDCFLEWGKTDRKFIRTWLKVASDIIAEVLEDISKGERP